MEPETVEITSAELVKLAAVNSELYARTYFPKTMRQKSPPFDKEVWDALDNPSVRYLNLRIFRGGTKTTKARLFTSKRIAYGISRTILYIGATEPAALRSIRWLKAQITKNSLWAQTFGLTPGSKWSESEIEIIHSKAGAQPISIWVIGVGVTSSQIRGINFDDYRPDTIVCDDILDDENTATEEQRNKLEDLVLGAVKNSLTPATEEPNAKLVMITTSQHLQDVSAKAEQDQQWKSIVIPCWTPETMDFPVDQQISIWPERYPSDELRMDKLSALKRNKLSIFVREMECRHASSENAAFLPNWVNYYVTQPAMMRIVMAVDPVPPPSPRQLQKNLINKDYETFHVWGQRGQDYYLLDRRAMRGHDPGWSIMTFFELNRKWRPFTTVVETVAYQRVLKWLLEKEMQRRRVFYNVTEPSQPNKSKYNRIVGAFAFAAHGHLWVRANDTPFITQFQTYPNSDHDDELDAASMALNELINPYLEQANPSLFGIEDDVGVEELEIERACP